MKVGGLLSMTASNFIMRDILIRYNKGERMRLTHLIVFEVKQSYLHHTRVDLLSPFSCLSCVSKLFIGNDSFPKLNGKLSCAVFWGSFFSPFMSTWMGKSFFLNYTISCSMFILQILRWHVYTISVPEDTDIYLAAGNTDSCTAQGFLEAFFYGTAVYMNAILAFTYCVIVKRGRKDEATGSLWIVSL